MSARVDYRAMTERQCTICASTKPVSEFGRYADESAPLTGWRYYSRCKDCNKRQCREYGASAKPARNARLRRWRKANPAKAAVVDRRKRLSSLYGMTPADFARMTDEQRGRCLLCCRAAKLVVDHDHDTGRVRGLLCHRCNVLLGWIEAHPGIATRITAYTDAPCHADVLLRIANEAGE